MDELEEFYIDDFKDETLYSRYGMYKSILERMQISLINGDADSTVFIDDWNNKMEERAKILYDINLKHNLNIADENKEMFDQVLSSASRLVKIDEMKKVLSEIKVLVDVKVEIEDNSIAVTYNTESALSNKSFVASKTGFPSKAMDILTVLKDYDYEDIVITTVNNDVVAASAYFDKDSLYKTDFDRWDKLDSVDAYKFYAMTKAYHIRSGIWEELDAETKKLIGDMNKRNSNEFWGWYGFMH